MGITKQDLKELPKSPIGSESKQHAVDYVEAVMGGSSRAKALQLAYPDRYNRAVERSSGNNRVVEANIKKEYNQIERAKYVTSLFVAADKTWFTRFFDKKQKIYNKLYDIAMDDEQDTKDQISSMKSLLQYLPSAPREDKLEVTHRVQGEEFKDKLAAKKKELHEIANAIDVEVVNG